MAEFDMVQQNEAIGNVIDQSDTWTEQDQHELVNFSLQHAAVLFSESGE